jgi:hypothetical protein
MSSSSSKIEQFINKLLINYNVSKIAPVCFLHQHVLQNTQIFVGECSVLRLSVSSALKLLGYSSVGVMDPQIHCAVVTLVASNCLKKLMSHSCPRSYFVLLSYAGTGSRCRRTRKGVVTSGPNVYMPEVWASTLVFSHSVTDQR